MSVCKVGALLCNLGAEDAVTLAAALDKPTEVPAIVLSLALTRMGHDVGPTTVKDHRGARCVCTRKG